MKNFSKNLLRIIKFLNITNQQAANEIGIHINTLSNVLNEKFPPSDDVNNKIEKWVMEKGFTKTDLTKETLHIEGIRIHTSAELSGNEKATFKKFVQNLECVFESAIKKKFESVADSFFDLYTLPYGDELCFYYSMRLNMFVKKIKSEKWNLKKWLDYFQKPCEDTKEFWGRPYYSISFFNLYVKPDIIELVSSLGIEIGFFSFGTKKIESLSTSLEPNHCIIDGGIRYSPTIIINTDCCKTSEKCRFLVAKEFYNQINYLNQSEYITFDYNDDLMIKNSFDKEAELFAKEMLIPKNTLKSVWKVVSEYPYSICSKITKLKNDFNVSCSLLISRLNELKLIDYKCSQYFKDLEDEYDGEVNYVDKEPFPSSENFKANDFFSYANENS